MGGALPTVRGFDDARRWGASPLNHRRGQANGGLSGSQQFQCRRA